MDIIFQSFNTFVDFIIKFSEILPLPLFVFAGALLEDLISAIPSAAVYGVAGSIAAQRGYNWFMLAVLIMIATLGKTIAAGIFYIIADKFEDHIPDKIRKFLKLDHEKIEEFGKKFSKGRRDDILIFVLRAIPSSPSMTLAFAAGFIKTNFKTFIIASYLGYLIPTTLYFLAGFYGVEFVKEIFINLSNFLS